MIGYDPTSWVDEVKDQNGDIIQEGTPVSATNMNKIEQGIFNAHQELSRVRGDLETVQESVEEEFRPIIQSIITDVANIGFQLIVNNLMNNIDMNHVFVDVIDNANSVKIVSGKYVTGKVFV